MNRFSVLDHFVLSAKLFEECVSNASALNEIDNFFDHDPLFMS
jgi:hypothetical protein